MKVLILGVTSCIGYRFFRLNEIFDVYGICRNWPHDFNNNIFVKNDFDIEFIKDVIKIVQPDIVINCLSVADVDKCESDEFLSNKINYELVLSLVSLSVKLSLKMVFFSTSLIYDGLNPPYSESTKAIPINKYASIKHKADEYISNNLEEYLLIRPTTVIGVSYPFQRRNPVSFIVEKLASGEKIRLVDDVKSNLVFLDDLVTVLAILISRRISGTFNVGGDLIVSRFSLGIKLANLMGAEEGFIEKCCSSSFDSLAKRPLNTTVDTSKLNNITGFKFTEFSSGLKKVVSEQKLISNSRFTGAF